MSASPYIATITILDDPYLEKGYTLTNREFFLKYSEPVFGEGEWLDGTKLPEKYYVVSLKEYFRVVPEAMKENIRWTEEIYFPIHLCHRSFKPSYIK